MAALDIAGAVFLGDDEIGALNDDTPPSFIHNLDAFGFLGLGGLKWKFPWVLTLFGWVPWPRWRDFVTSSDQKYAYGDAVYRRYLAKYGGRNSSDRRADAISHLLRGDEKIEPLTDDETSSEVTGLLTEGTEPVGITMTFMLWELARNPQWQDALRAEFRDHQLAFADGVVPAYNEIERLDTLEAVFVESLRLHPSAPGSLPRLSPEGGAILGGYYIPAGVRTLHFPSIPRKRLIY